MDDLKKYLQQHKLQLNEVEDVPSRNVWEGIEQKVALPNVKRINFNIYAWAVAACCIVLAGLGIHSFLFHDRAVNQNTIIAANNNQNKPAAYNSKPKSQQAVSKPSVNTSNNGKLIPNKPVKSTNPTKNKKQNTEQPSFHGDGGIGILNGIESNFMQVINLQKSRINQMPIYIENPSYFSDFKNQLNQMEKDEKQIKKDIQINGLTDELLEQLINIYQQKITVLKQLQNEIKKTNSRGTLQQQKSNKQTSTYFINI